MLRSTARLCGGRFAGRAAAAAAAASPAAGAVVVRSLVAVLGREIEADRLLSISFSNEMATNTLTIPTRIDIFDPFLAAAILQL